MLYLIAMQYYLIITNWPLNSCISQFGDIDSNYWSIGLIVFSSLGCNWAFCESNISDPKVPAFDVLYSTTKNLVSSYES